MNGAAPLLFAEAVTIRRGTREVVHDVGLTLQRGQLWAMLGSNGAGKSTLLRALAGLLPVSQGRLEVQGRALKAWPRPELARQVAWLSQAGEEGSGFRGLEYVLLGRAPHLSAWAVPSDADVLRAREALEEVGVPELSGRALTELSGGERRLLAVARAFVQEAPLLLLDEPTAFLDLRHQVQVLDRVRARVAKGACAVVILHDVNLAAAFADQIFLMHEGRSVAQGAPQQVLTPAILESTFGVRMRQAICEGGQALFAPELKAAR